MTNLPKLITAALTILFLIILGIVFIAFLEEVKEDFKDERQKETIDEGISFLEKIVNFVSLQNPVFDLIIIIVVGLIYWVSKPRSRLSNRF